MLLLAFVEEPQVVAIGALQDELAQSRRVEHQSGQVVAAFEVNDLGVREVKLENWETRREGSGSKEMELPNN